MPKIKHIAISSQDPDKTAQFYKEVFGMEEAGKIDNPNTTGYYLTDGYINLAILHFKNDVVAGADQPCSRRRYGWPAAHQCGSKVHCPRWRHG